MAALDDSDPSVKAAKAWAAVARKHGLRARVLQRQSHAYVAVYRDSGISETINLVKAEAIELGIEANWAITTSYD